MSRINSGAAGALVALVALLATAVPALAVPSAATNDLPVGAGTRGSVAMAGNGSFVVTWGSHTDPQARLFNAVGQPLTVAFKVEATPSGEGSEPGAAMDANGNFVIVWEGARSASDVHNSVEFRLFNAAGTPVATEANAALSSTLIQDVPVVAMAANGKFAIAWESCTQLVDPPYEQCGNIIVRLFAANGTALTGPLTVNSPIGPSDSAPNDPAIAMDATGNFVVAWQGLDQCHVYARVYNSSGSPTSGQVPVPTGGECNYAPAVAMQASGASFIVGWDSETYATCCTEQIKARRFNLSGTALTGEMIVHSSTTTASDDPGIAADSRGGFMVAWTAPDPDGDGIFARRYDAGNVSDGTEFRVNQATVGDQYGEDPQGTSVASDTFGAAGATTLRFAFTWASDPGNGDSMIARRFNATAPGAISRQPDGSITRGTAPYVGDNIYNLTGVNQSKTGSAAAGNKVTFKIKVQNDGTGADKISIRATGTAVTGYTVTFKQGTTNITSQVVAGTYQTASLAPGSFVTIKAIVTITSSAAEGSSLSRLVTLTSVADATKKDAVGLTASRT